jgi:hypothetical protein
MFRSIPAAHSKPMKMNPVWRGGAAAGDEKNHDRARNATAESACSVTFGTS